MEFEPLKILEILAGHNVDFVVVGGIGGVLHGSPALTDDVDIVPELNETNLDALAAALNAMNCRIRAVDSPDGIKVDFTGRRLKKWLVEFRFLNLDSDYGRLDLMHRPGGTDGYEDLAPNAESLDIDGVAIRVAALEDIIRSKEAVGREVDLQQLPILRALLEKKQKSSDGC